MNQPKKRKARGAIDANWVKIQEWLAAGYSIPSIYAELFEQKEITCSLVNFKTYYYRVKKEKGEGSPVSVPPASTPTSTHVGETLQVDLSDDTYSDQFVETKPFDFEEQQRLAEAVFRKLRS